MSEVVSFLNYTPPARFDTVPWTEAQIEEATSQNGTWAIIDTVTLGTADTDPSAPAARSFTTSLGTAVDRWYRVSFLDGDGNASEPTAAVQNGRPNSVRFATSDDLAVRLGLDLTYEELARADTLLAIASGIIQSETRQTIELVEDDVLTLTSLSSTRIRLPQRPVVSVSSVMINDVELAQGSNWYLDGDEIVGSPYGPLARRCFSGFGPVSTLTVTYTHGWESVPPIVRGVCLEMVVRCFINPGAVVQSSVGDASDVYTPYSAPPTGLLLTEAEKTSLHDALSLRYTTMALR